jgi:hypothetical protein
MSTATPGLHSVTAKIRSKAHLWRQRDADAVVMLHPDGQYQPELIPSMVEPISPGGPTWSSARGWQSREWRSRTGCPRWKYYVNSTLTTIENRIMGTQLSEAHTGYRARVTPVTSNRKSRPPRPRIELSLNPGRERWGAVR